METGVLEEKRTEETTVVREKLRRYSDRLATAGTGVMLFAIWSIVKAIMQVFVRSPLQTEIAQSVGENSENMAFMTVFYIALFATIGVEVGVRFFIGRSGRAEGKGKKKGRLYLIVAYILIPLYALGVVFSIFNLSYIENSVVDTIVTLIVDITSLSALIELAFSGTMVKKLKKKLKTSEDRKL